MSNDEMESTNVDADSLHHEEHPGAGAKEVRGVLDGIGRRREGPPEERGSAWLVVLEVWAFDATRVRPAHERALVEPSEAELQVLEEWLRLRAVLARERAVHPPVKRRIHPA